MAKKRKSEFGGLEDADRTLYSSFCAAANSISQLYTQAQNQQRLAFQAGERHATERLQQWITREQNGATFLSIESIMNFLQRESEHTEEATMSPSSLQHLPAPGLTLAPQAGAQNISSQTPTSVTGHFDSSKASVFSSALSSSLQRRNLSPFAMPQNTLGQGMAAVSHEEMAGAYLEAAGRSSDHSGAHVEQQQHQYHSQQPPFGHPVQDPGPVNRGGASGSGPVLGGQQQTHVGFQQQLGRANYAYGMSHLARDGHGQGFGDNDANMDTYSR